MPTRTTSKVLAAAVAASCLGASAAWANCPTPANGDAAKYMAIYNQNPQNIGNAWRLYIRPRNGACLQPANTGYQSPKDTPGQSNGSKESAAIHDGGHNCSDNYKSYISVNVPNAQAVYDTFTKYKTSTGQPQPTIIGWSVGNTKTSSSKYEGAILVAPMKNPDGTPSNTQVQSIGVCFK